MVYAQHHRRIAVITIVIGLLSLATSPASTSLQQQQRFEGFVGGIRANAVKGEVFYQREDGKFNLEAGLKLQEGDLIKSGPHSFAELLLQPGNYLRVGEDSECQIISDQHDRMRLKLNRGAISLEILSKDGDYWRGSADSLSQGFELIRVITPNAGVFVSQPGIFRINDWGGERTDLIVRDGEAVINGRRVKKRQSAVASSDGINITDINSKIVDSFDSWSRERADEQVQANRLLKKGPPWTDKRKEGEEPSFDLPKDEAPGSKNRLVVSARPGTVTFVDAGVQFSQPTKEWEPVTETSHLKTGDRLSTSAHSYAELTMLPDINLRIDGGSEILFEQMSNESISLKLLRGSAILDVVRFDKEQVPAITLAGASTSVAIADDGNYRIDVGPNGDEITIRDGKAIFQQRSVGSCRKIAGGTISECDKKRSDNFDFWSYHRGEGEFFDGRAPFAMVAHLDRLRRVQFRNRGFWFQNPGKTHYTFVPFSYPLFRSPYGGNYSTVLTPRPSMIRIDRRDRRPLGRPSQGPLEVMP